MSSCNGVTDTRSKRHAAHAIGVSRVVGLLGTAVRGWDCRLHNERLSRPYNGGNASFPVRIYFFSCTAYPIVSAVYRDDVRTYHYRIGGVTPDTHITGVDRRYRDTVERLSRDGCGNPRAPSRHRAFAPRPNRRKAVTLRCLRNLDRGFLASEPLYIVHGSFAALTPSHSGRLRQKPPRRHRGISCNLNRGLLWVGPMPVPSGTPIGRACMARVHEATVSARSVGS